MAEPRSLKAQGEERLSTPPDDVDVLCYRDDLAEVRQFTAIRAQRAGLLPHRADDLVLAVAELAANTLAHTGGPGTLTTWVTGSEVVCQTQDQGHLTDPLAGKVRPGPDGPCGRRGLWVVHQVCDLVEMCTSPAGTTVRLHMRRGDA